MRDSGPLPPEWYQPSVFLAGQGAGKSRFTFLRYEAFPTSGQADHDDAYSGMIDGDAFAIGFLISDHCGVNVGIAAVMDVREIRVLSRVQRTKNGW